MKHSGTYKTVNKLLELWSDPTVVHPADVYWGEQNGEQDRAMRGSLCCEYPGLYILLGHG